MNPIDPNTQANLLWQSYWQQAQASVPLSDTFEADFWAAYEPLIQQKKSSNIQAKPLTIVQDELSAKFYKYWNKALEVEKIFYAKQASNIGEVVLGGCLAYVLMGVLFVGSLIFCFAGEYQWLKLTIPALIIILVFRGFWGLNNTNAVDYDQPPEKRIMIALNHDTLKLTEFNSTNKKPLVKALKYENIGTMWRVEDGLIISGKVNEEFMEIKVPSGLSIFNEMLFFMSEVVSYNYLRKQA